MPARGAAVAPDSVAFPATPGVSTEGPHGHVGVRSHGRGAGPARFFSGVGRRSRIAERIATRRDAGDEPRPSRRPIVLAVVLAAAFGLAELPFASFMADDLMQLAVLERVTPCEWIGPLDLYDLADGVPAHTRAMQDAGAVPWFFDAHVTMAFFRPLTSALLAFDHAVWGLRPVGYRLDGALWFVVLVAAVGLVLRRGLPGPLGGLALLIFTIAGVHGMLAWNATRHVVVGGALGMLALAAHVRARETRWRAGGPLAIGALVLALCASEAALAAAAYLFAYEALAAPGSARARLRAAAPALVPCLLYVVGYRLAGYGTSPGIEYVDPLATPAAFLLALPGRWLVLAGALLSGVGADVWTIRPALRPALVLGGAAIVCAFAMAWRMAWHDLDPAARRGVRWLVAGAAASAVPFAGAPLGARCLVLPMIGGSVAIAVVIRAWWGGRTRSGSGARSGGPRRGSSPSRACCSRSCISSSRRSCASRRRSRSGTRCPSASRRRSATPRSMPRGCPRNASSCCARPTSCWACIRSSTACSIACRCPAGGARCRGRRRPIASRAAPTTRSTSSSSAGRSRRRHSAPGAWSSSTACASRCSGTTRAGRHASASRSIDRSTIPTSCCSRGMAVDSGTWRRRGSARR